MKGPFGIETKYDGERIQIHKDGYFFFFKKKHFFVEVLILQ